MVTKKIHLATREGIGARSRCRYSSRPSRRVRIVSLAEFQSLPAETKCSECARAAERLEQQAACAAEIRVELSEAQASEFQMMYVDTGVAEQVCVTFDGRAVSGQAERMRELACLIEADYHAATGFEVGGGLSAARKGSMRLLATNINKLAACGV